MSTEQAACMGCFVNYPTQWMQPDYPKFINNELALTDKEKECLALLAESWKIFVELDAKHPQDDSEFCTALHDAQKMIALRVARRIDKDVWSQHD